MNKLKYRVLLISCVKSLPIMFIAFVVSIIGLLLDFKIIVYIGIGLWILSLDVILFLSLRDCFILSKKCDSAKRKRLLKELGEFDYFEAYGEVHGDELLTLSDCMLVEIVSFQTNNIIKGIKDNEFEALCKPRQVVYILSTFDNEIQNGGLYQLFANCTCEFVAHVSDFLDIVSACGQKSLYDDFLKENSIDFSEISSFKAETVEEYIEKEKMLDYDKFNNAYYKIQPTLYKKIADYIRTNISEF